MSLFETTLFERHTFLYDNNLGHRSRAISTITEFLGSIQPVIGEELSRIATGNELMTYYKVYTRSTLKNDDEIVDKDTGNRYRIIRTENWTPYQPDMSTSVLYTKAYVERIM